MYCSECGIKLPDGESFCYECGAKVGKGVRMVESERWAWDTRDVTDDEKLLNKTVYAEWDYFEDMTFEEEELIEQYCTVVYQMKDGEPNKEILTLPDWLKFFDYHFFDFYVKDLGGKSLGTFDEKHQSIIIDKSVMHDKNFDGGVNEVVILHEMIHLHEYVVDESPLFYHDILVWYLYNKLKKEILDLDERINKHIHLGNEQQIQRLGGLHDLLFLLKSFDLDLKKGYSLGTVFGYGMSD